jgi:hypothetical protein
MSEKSDIELAQEYLSLKASNVNAARAMLNEQPWRIVRGLSELLRLNAIATDRHSAEAATAEE